MNPSLPWYRRTFRWGQTNLSEQDPLSYELNFWRQQWRRTHVQGVIVNAGGIVAFYPSRFSLQERAQFLGEGDLFGEITRAARAAGLAVLARMDSNRASEAFYQEHPDWFTVDADGKPGMAGVRYIACLNSPYTRQYLPQVLKEIIDTYHPDGFTDNGWTGPGRGWICHCAYCVEKFRAEAGLELPGKADWDDPVYRRWVRWSYACRTEIWELNNTVTRSAGGSDCLWLGMVNGDPFRSHLAFCDLKAIGERSASEMWMSDQQGRGTAGFEQNAQSGKLLHGLLGWEKLIPESMALYVRGEQAFRKASAPALEAQKWMVSGFAGGISPWWHHVGAEQEDRRQFETAPALMAWHADNEDVLYHRLPVARVGVVWSHENNDFYGRDQVERRIGESWRGITLALAKKRIPYLPIHADNIDRDAERFNLNLLILPELAVMTDEQCQVVRQFVGKGGGLLASGLTSLLDVDGCRRLDFGLADVLGVHFLGELIGAEGDSTSWETASGHTYLRLGPTLPRHPILEAFQDTAILPFGGSLQPVSIDDLAGSEVETIASFIPAFPIYPPETSWMRQRDSNLPAILTRQLAGGGRLVYFAADIDRCYGRRGLPDHGELLVQAVRWATREVLPFKITGPGFVDCHLYRQEDRLILHLVNLSGCHGDGYLDEHLPVGPLQIAIRLDGQTPVSGAVCRVGGEVLPVTVEAGWARFEISRLVDHELIVLEKKEQRARENPPEVRR